jgi:hypothetical protein
MTTIDLIDIFCRQSIIGIDPIDVFLTIGAQLCSIVALLLHLSSCRRCYSPSDSIVALLSQLSSCRRCFSPSDSTVACCRSFPPAAAATLLLTQLSLC